MLKIQLQSIFSQVFVEVIFSVLTNSPLTDDPGYSPTGPTGDTWKLGV
ncbi:hypothetical protein HanPI659440_Chr16g0649241 [Helianthus annuus]|nr:hypothetical protein HanPI659440_Chr16g0649241 [Helianthus annuus]